MTFEVRDIRTWVVMSQEARGLDAKDWIVPADQVQRAGQTHWWLYKPVKTASYRRYDDWSERLACALAGLLGLPAARVELAQGVADNGIISKNVIPDGWTLESGDTLLSEVPGYESCAGEVRPKNRRGHHLRNIADVLEGCAGPPGSACATWTAMEVFVGYLVFDAWIANTDRHAINWGVLSNATDPSARALAATFDHGTALASGAQDERLVRVDVEDFAHRGFATRFDDGHGLTLTALSRQATGLIGGRSNTWIDRLAELRPSQVDAVIDESNLSQVRRRFLSTLLETNRRRLIE